MSAEFRKLKPDAVASGLLSVIKESPEEDLPSNDGTRFTTANQPGESSNIEDRKSVV